MLDISFGEIAVVGAAAYLLLGPAQLKAGAFMAGRGLGRAVGFVGRSRSALETMVANPQLKGVNSDLSQSFQEFAMLRRELQSATLNPIENVKTAIIGTSVGGTYSLSENSPAATSAAPMIKAPETLPIMSSRGKGGGVGFVQQASGDGGADIFLVAMQERALLLEYERMSRGSSGSTEGGEEKT